MSPTNRRHGALESRLARLLGNFVDEHDLGDVSVGEVGIYTRRNSDTVRGADIGFHSHERLAQVQSEVYFDVAPELVVEILSPSDRWQDVQRKLDEYFGIGVQRVWLMDPAQARVHVHHHPTAARLLERADTLEGEGVLNGFALPLAQLFR